MKERHFHQIERARELRKDSTFAEKVLWQALRNRRLSGLRFKRQQPMGGYVVDFYCPRLRLIIELEGSVHDNPDQRAHDRDRFEELQIRGLRVLRIRNEVVMKDLGMVLEQILSFKS